MNQPPEAPKPTPTAYKNLIWWSLLATAVLAVPAAAIIVSTAVRVTGIHEIVIFVLACWFCIYISLRFLKNPRVMPIFFEQVTLSEHARQSCMEMVGQIETEVAKWEKRYNKCEPVFMNLSRQPAWEYLEEIIQVMIRIKQSVLKDGTAPLPEIRSLHAWVEGPKPQAIEGYLRTLQAVYTYSKAVYAEQGKNIDALFSELGNGHLDAIVSTPRRVKNSAQELLNTIRNEQPVLAATLAAKALN